MIRKYLYTKNNRFSHLLHPPNFFEFFAVLIVLASHSHLMLESQNIKMSFSFSPKPVPDINTPSSVTT